MNILDQEIQQFNDMKKYPKRVFYSGNINLLELPMISIVGTRKPSKYTREIIHTIASQLADRGIVVVSGGAIGVDAIVHKAAGSNNTISVLPCGIDIKYPAINKNLLYDIEKNGLLLSQFENSFKATPWSFVIRNEMVVALGEILIVAEADLNSGSMRSVEFALQMKKDIYVLPHRIGESKGTNELLKKGLAKAIYDTNDFFKSFSKSELHQRIEDDFILYCQLNPSYEDALKKFPSRIFEAELEGIITVKNSKIYLI